MFSLFLSLSILFIMPRETHSIYFKRIYITANSFECNYLMMISFWDKFSSISNETNGRRSSILNEDLIRGVYQIVFEIGDGHFNVSIQNIGKNALAKIFLAKVNLEKKSQSFSMEFISITNFDRSKMHFFLNSLIYQLWVIIIYLFI